MNTYLSDNPSKDEYILALLRRAIVQVDQDARVEVQQCLSEVVRGWLRWHPKREAACRLDSAENYVAVTFERFWQGTIYQQIDFSVLATALHYLYMSLNGAILDRLRASSRPNEVPLPQSGSAKEPPMEDATSGAEVWERLQRMFLNAHEQRLAYLLFHCGLKPGEIVHCCSREYSDLYEIYRLRRDIMKRLVCNIDHLRLR